jgi:predicted Na+-dependent transporter
VLWKVVTIFLLPVVLGIAVGMLWPGSTPALLKRLRPIATIGQLTLLVLALLASGPAIVGLGLPAIGMVVVVVGSSIVVGHLLGGPTESSRPILASTLAFALAGAGTRAGRRQPVGDGGHARGSDDRPRR